MSHDVRRILDASLNRAREAMRVMEDYCRFVLDDERLCRQLKEARHELADATRAIEQEAILHRDTPGDVGADVKLETELARSSAHDVLTAAGKRLGESLRSIEEYLKLIEPAAARRVEAVRYRAYTIESDLALRLNRGERMRDIRLCVLITESECTIPWFEAATQALDGGVRCLQLREKSLDAGVLLERAKRLLERCRSRGALLIVNDRVDIAAASGADGVHLGQTDLPVRDARRILGQDRIIGKSTHNMDQAQQAIAEGADYIGVGPMYRSSTKPRDFVAGPEFARSVARDIRIPALAIGGITRDNLEEVLASGIHGVAVTRAVVGVPDVLEQARLFSSRIALRTSG